MKAAAARQRLSPTGAFARLRGMAANVRGTAIIEFALVAAPFLALLLGTVEIAILFFVQQGLETGAEGAARRIMTGEAQSGKTTQAAFHTIACQALPPYISCGNVMVDVQTASSFAAISTAIPTLTYDKSGNISNNWNYNPGGTGSIVILRLMYVWPFPTGPLNFRLTNLAGGKRLMVATSVFKSESY